MDHHIPLAISEGLITRGVDIVTAQEDGTATLDDEALLSRATLLNRVLFSQDRDLLIITNQWLESGRDFAGLIYSHQLSITIGRAVRALEIIAQTLDPQDMLNRIEFIPL